ncbi:protein of unknown function [Paenibacillus sp. 1_12]|uniref:DUF4153 domain-containing protein n=1 Tax=Paenibacillus sp. 1_12 TaxID=1566278 RepID=UPI0008E4657F|nr:DUF4173 domain-containing protein [Paenibacillus sp. 1_12]SFL72454.1 protein of unknown function [Paenibacillus sp. 1_12]
MLIFDEQRSKQQALLLIGALVCGCIHHLLFYDQEWGVSYPLFIAVFYIYYYWALREKIVLRLDASFMLLIPIALLSLTYAVFSNTLFMVLNALAIPCLIFVHTTWTLRRPAIRWYDASMVVAVLEQLLVHTMRHVPRPAVVLIRCIKDRIQTGRSQRMWKILIGIVISLPLVLLVGALLASADTMFDRLLSQLPELLGDVHLGETIFRIIWIGFIATVLFAYIWGLLYPLEKRHKPEVELWGYEAQASEGKADLSEFVNPSSANIPAVPRKKVRMDATVTITMLLILNTMYVLFAVVQFSYFFGGGVTALPAEMTYADYAHRGFAELVVVTVINFTLLMITLHGTDRSVRSMDIFLRLLLAVLIGCTGVMLCSAFMRMFMYEEAYGFSETRLLVDVFIVFLSILFAIALVKLWKDRLQLMKPYAILALAAYLIVNYMQVDAIVASNNINRFEAVGSIDTDYLSSLSFDAVPYLIELKKKHPELDGTNKAIQMMKRRLPLHGETSWVSFNLSVWKADRALQGIPLEPLENYSR